MKPSQNHGLNLLGKELKDPASGIIGIAEIRITFLNNNVRYSIQPMSEDSHKLEPGFDIDEHQLHVVGAGISKLRIDPPANIPLSLGMEVKDIVTGMKGVLTEKHESLNGCVYFVLTSKVTRLSDSGLQARLPYERLAKIGKGVMEKILGAQEKASAPLPAPAQGPGGPMTRRVR